MLEHDPLLKNGLLLNETDMTSQYQFSTDYLTTMENQVIFPHPALPKSMNIPFQ
jgi:hypothetical protein